MASEENKGGEMEQENEDKIFNGVFTCSECNTIVSDSQAWLSHDEDRKTVTFAYVTDKVNRGKSLMTSEDRQDYGSTYYDLECSQCDTSIGKIYKTTTREMDKVRDLYTVNAGCVDFYEIGGRTVQRAPLHLSTIDSLLAATNNTVPLNIIIQKIIELQNTVETYGQKIEGIENPAVFQNHSLQKGDSSSDENAHNGLISFILGLHERIGKCDRTTNDRLRKIEKLCNIKSKQSIQKSDDEVDESPDEQLVKSISSSHDSSASNTVNRSPRRNGLDMGTVNRKRELDSSSSKLKKKKKLV